MTEIKLLDHGYIKLIENWGSDETIVSSARMSTGKGFKGWDLDEKFLAFLYNNKHMTPFEMAGVTIEVKAPIFVFREWHRHRTQSYNEMSARYIPLPDENYVPSIERIMSPVETAKKSTNKQQQSDKHIELFTDRDVWMFQNSLLYQYEEQQKFYEAVLAHGIPKELARIALPVGRYSVMRASANLRNWLAFLTLRNDNAAQYEIRVYAEALQEILQAIYPRTMKLFNDERQKSAATA